MSISFNPIVFIHTPIKVKEESPIQVTKSEINGEAEVFPEFTVGLDGIEEFPQIYLLYHLYQSDQPVSMLEKLFLDDQTHGVFTTRHTSRPNPIESSIVRLLRRDNNRLALSGVDGTPLLDI